MQSVWDSDNICTCFQFALIILLSGSTSLCIGRYSYDKIYNSLWVFIIFIIYRVKKVSKNFIIVLVKLHANLLMKNMWRMKKVFQILKYSLISKNTGCNIFQQNNIYIVCILIKGWVSWNGLFGLLWFEGHFWGISKHFWEKYHKYKNIRNYMKKTKKIFFWKILHLTPFWIF